MANVQLADGYVRLANTLATAIALAPWDSPSQPRLVMALIRTTFGMNRKEADIGMAQWRAMTGMHDRQVRRAKESLQKAGVITLVRDFDARFQTPQRWQLNKDYETWGKYAVSVDDVQAAEDHATNQLPSMTAAAADDPRGHERPEGSRMTREQGSPTTPGQGSRTSIGTASNGANGNDLQGRKTVKDRKDIQLHTNGAHTREEKVAELKAYLGERRHAADRMAASTDHSPSWASAVLGLYGPNGTDTTVWGGVPPPDRPAALAMALDRYAGEAREYHGRLFRRFLQSVIEERANGNHRAGPGRQVRGKAASGYGGARDKYSHLVEG